MTSESSALSSVISDIYDAAIDPTRWQPALASICGFVHGSRAALLWHDSASQSSQVMHIFNDDPHYTKLYFEKYLPMNPLFPSATFMEVGVVHASSDIIPQAELEKTRFYKEWIAPQGIVDAVAVNLEKGIMRSSMINIQTDASYGPVDVETRRRLALLVPHLQRAVTIGRLFDQHMATEAVLTETLDHVEAAVLLVGADGSIVFANKPAQAMLAEATMVRKDGKVLRAVSGEADRTLRDVFTAAEAGDASVGVRGVAVPLSEPRDGWFAHVLPLTSGNRHRAGQKYSAVAAVLVRKSLPLEDPTPLETFARLYELTGGEVRVLDAALKAGSVKAMSAMLGISQATVKTHLQHVFRKTGTNRRSDLVKLIAGM